VNVEFECVVCGSTATATVSETVADDRPLETLRDCPICELETIWVAT
jgi:transcription elongation factor Elf1